MQAQIANHLNVVESAIVRVEEWAHVLFVVVKGLGARFVSKKVAAVQTIKTIFKNSSSALRIWKTGQQFRENGAVWEITSAVNTRIYWDRNQDDEIAEWEIEGAFVREIVIKNR